MNQIISYIKNKINKKQKIKITMNKNMNKKIFNLGILALAVVLMTGGVFVYKALAAAPAFTTDTTKTTSAEVYVKASSDWQNAIYFQITADNDLDYLKQVRFTINSIAGMGDGDEIAQIAVYKSTDATLVPADDSQVALYNSASINYDVPTTFSWGAKGTKNILTADGNNYFYLAFKTEDTWTTGDQITISMAIGDVLIDDVDAGDISNGAAPETDNFTADITAVTISSAAYVSDTSIDVTLSELANQASITAADDGGFIVTETGNGLTYTVSEIAPQGDNEHVRLTVANMIVSGKEGVTVTYSSAGNGNVTDVAGNEMVTDGTGKNVAAWDETAPTLPAANIDVDTDAQPNTVIVEFDEALNQALAEDTANWTVTNIGAGITYDIDTAALSSATVTLTLVAVNPASNTTFITNAINNAGVVVTPGAAITDLAGNTYAAGAVTENGGVHTTDDVVPTLSPVTIASDNTVTTLAKVDDTVTISFTSNELITTPAVADVQIDGNNADAVDCTHGGSSSVCTATRVMQALDTEQAVVFTIDFDDVAGGSGVQVTAITEGSNVTFDETAPTISNVTASTDDGYYNAGETIAVTVVFSETVNVVDVPQIELETGATNRYATYNTGTGTDTLTFNYIVQATDISADLDYVATSSLGLNGGTIKDAVGNDATLTMAEPGEANSLGNNKAIVIDTIQPTVALTYVPDRVITPFETIVVTATFTDTNAISEVAVPQIAITTPGDGDLSATDMTKDSNTVWTYDWSVPGDVDEQGTATIAITATDLAGNTNEAASHATRTIDSIAPIVDSFTAGSITATGAILTVVTNENAICAYAINDIAYGDMTTMATTTSVTTHTQPLTGLSGSTDYDYYVRCADASDNTGIYSAHAGFTTLGSDLIGPTIDSQTPLDNATSTAITVSPTLTFNEALDASTVNSATIQLRASSTNAAVSATVLYNPATYVVTIDPVASLGYDTSYYLFAVGVKDSAGNTLTTDYSATTKADHEFTTAEDGSDLTHPTVSSIDPTNGTTGVDIEYLPMVEFSEIMDDNTLIPNNIKICLVSDASCDSQIDTLISSAQSATGTEAVIIPQSYLSYGTSYWIYVGTGVTDSAENALETPYGSTSTSAFTTAAEGDASLGVTGVSAERTWAVPGGDFDDGWKWIIFVDVPNDETQLRMKFSNWTGTGTTIGAANNIQFYSEQADEAVDQDNAIPITVAGDYSAVMTLDDDDDDDQDGRQIQIIVEVKVPTGSTGSYSSSYGISTAEPS